MTVEKDAKGKWCPYRKTRSDHDNCLGADCMAWRWVDPGKTEIVRHFVTGVHMSVKGALAGIPAGWQLAESEVERVKLWRTPASSFLIEREWTEAREGFCGAFEPRITEITQ